MERSRVGVVGCGGISPAYLTAPERFPTLDVVACADLDIGRAERRAVEFGVPLACGVDDLLAMDDVDVVVNLTPPAAHHEVSLAAIAAGRSVYSEKPLAADRAQAQELIAAARDRGVLLGCSPDTFLGPAYQTARSLVDWGAIGEPVGAVAFFASRGPDASHQDPGFLYRPGAGPLLDMGPYYVAALVNLLGPVVRVTGSTTTGTPDRLVLTGPRRGQTVPVDTPTHVSATLTFASGAVATLMTSFEVWATNLPRIEVHGTGGALSLPDPDEYGGSVRWHQAGWTSWREVPTGAFPTGRGVGLADLAAALRTGRPHRADGELAAHVMDVLLAVLESDVRGEHLAVHTTFTPGRPVPAVGVEHDPGP